MDDNILSFLILLVISSFIKGAFYASRPYVDSSFTNFFDLYDHILDAIYLLVGVYILAVMKTPSPLYIIAAVVFLQKAILHFVVFFRLYTAWGLSPQTEQNLIQYKKMASMVTDYGILFISLYLLSQIFLQ